MYLMQKKANTPAEEPSSSKQHTPAQKPSTSKQHTLAQEQSMSEQHGSTSNPANNKPNQLMSQNQQIRK